MRLDSGNNAEDCYRFDTDMTEKDVKNADKSGGNNSAAKETGKKPAVSAFDAAVKYLSVAPRSEKEVRDKLYKKGYRKSEVEDALARAKGYRYIDDERYARDFAEYYGAKTGRKKVEYKLVFEKGVSAEIARAAVDDGISDEDEREKALTAARKYVAAKRITERKDLGKVGAHLYRNGFERGIIDGVLDEIARNLAGDDF